MCIDLGDVRTIELNRRHVLSSWVEIVQMHLYLHTVLNSRRPNPLTLFQYPRIHFHRWRNLASQPVVLRHAKFPTPLTLHTIQMQ